MKGIGPYASGKILQRIVARPNISGVPSTPGESGATLGKHRGQGFPSSVPGCARSTFPGGEGFLRRERSLTFPWGKVPPQRRKRGGTGLGAEGTPES